MKTPATDSLDEILDKFNSDYRAIREDHIRGVYDIDQAFKNIDLSKSEAKAAIHAHYISREAVAEAIGPDLDYRGNSPEVMVNDFKRKLSSLVAGSPTTSVTTYNTVQKTAVTLSPTHHRYLTTYLLKTRRRDE